MLSKSKLGRFPLESEENLIIVNQTFLAFFGTPGTLVLEKQHSVNVSIH